MKLRAFVMCALLALSSVFVVSPVLSDDAAVGKEIEAQVQAMGQAVQKMDTDAVGKMLHPDFRHVDLFGRERTGDAWLSGVKERLGSVEGLAVAPKVNALTVEGDKAMPVIAIKLTGTVQQEGQPVPLEVSEVYRDTWEKTSEGWKRKQARLVIQDIRINKRPVRPMLTPEAEEARKAIQPLYDALGDLYTKRDWAALEKAMPENLSASEASGKPLTRKEIIERVKEGAKNLSDPIMTVAIKQIEVEGMTARVVRTMTVLGDITLPGGNRSRLRYVASTRDTYTKAEKGWAIKSSEELHSEGYLDGKLVPLAAFGGK